MDNPLNESTQQKARELANSITVAHDLDPEIQEELYGHIEDKLLAYRRGEEAITDEDALILVREHFGNTKTLRNLLQEVHMEAVQVTLLRKLSALAIVTLGLGVMTRTMYNVLVGLAAFLVTDGGRSNVFLFEVFFAYFVAVAGLAGFLVLLGRWKRAEHGGARPWYCRWRARHMIVLAAALLVLDSAFPTIVFTWQFDVPPLNTSYTWIMPALFWAWTIGMYVVWFWWAEAATRPVGQMIAIACAWAAFQLVSTSVLVTFLITLGSGSLPDQFITFADGRMGGMDVSAYYAYYGIGSTLGRMQLLAEYGFGAAICTPVLWAGHRLWFRHNDGQDLPSMQS